MPTTTQSHCSKKQERLLQEVAAYTEDIRKSPFLVNTDDSIGDPYPSPITGTTAFCFPDERGVYYEPVYYDWGANWDFVKHLVPGTEVQNALCLSLKNCDEYYFTAYDKKTIWPWLFNHHRRYGNGEQDCLMNQFLPPETIRKFNSQMADYLQAVGERWVKANAIMWNLHNDEDDEDCGDGGEVLDEDVWLTWEEELQPFLWEASMGMGSPFAHKFVKACEEALCDPDRADGMREKLLLCCPSSYRFMPLNYVLAKLVSPPHTELRIYASDEYSVIHDVTHNIVFDNFWYFCGVSASETLSAAGKEPQLKPGRFDYSLRGLRK